MNIHFRRCETTYEKTLDQMLEQNIVSTRGLKPDAKIFEEMVFDVNTGYFEAHGGYEYAKQFFEEVYHFAEKEIGSRYILSAVMHADEHNKSLSEQLGKDVYHYHMHVIYIPVVEKAVKWSKRCRDPTLVGTTKETIHQISHSKKWAYPTAKDEFGRELLNKNGKPKRIPSYSLLQSRFFNHMKQAGFKDFERGIEGSTTKHQTTMEYKVEQERQKLAQFTVEAEKQEKALEAINRDIAKVQPIQSTFNEIAAIGKKKRFGDKVEMTVSEYEKMTALAKFGIAAQQTIANLKKQLAAMRDRYWEATEGFNRLYEETKPFFEAMKLAPQRVKDLLNDIFEKAKEAREQKSLYRVSAAKLKHTDRDDR